MKQTSKEKSNIYDQIGNFVKNVNKMIYNYDSF
jgi:hypothetical protein